MEISIERRTEDGQKFALITRSLDHTTHGALTSCDQQAIREVLAMAATEIERIVRSAASASEASGIR